MRYRSKGWGIMPFDRDTAWFPAFAREAYRLLKNDRHLYVFCNDHCIGPFRAALLEAGFTPKRTLVWVKDQHTGGDLSGDYANRTEFILYAQKGRRALEGRRGDNVLEFPRVLRRQHPTEKPVGLMRYLIGKSTTPGELVLDPFAGSGTVCQAAKELGRRYLGVELVAGYVEVARGRCPPDDACNVNLAGNNDSGTLEL
jgi:site-specific DNA-methyltransferase (adenine-specific)